MQGNSSANRQELERGFSSQLLYLSYGITQHLYIKFLMIKNTNLILIILFVCRCSDTIL